jgi:hypothetical protein
VLTRFSNASGYPICGNCPRGSAYCTKNGTGDIVLFKSSLFYDSVPDVFMTTCSKVMSAYKRDRFHKHKVEEATCESNSTMTVIGIPLALLTSISGVEKSPPDGRAVCFYEGYDHAAYSEWKYLGGYPIGESLPHRHSQVNFKWPQLGT